MNVAITLDMLKKVLSKLLVPINSLQEETSELNKQLQSMENRIKELEDNTIPVNSLQEEISELNKRLQSMENRIKELEDNTIPAPEPGEIILNPTSIKFTEKNKTQNITATLTGSLVGLGITWKSSNPNIATVNNSGKVTALSNGSCTITASCGSYSATCSVIVEIQEPVVKSYTITNNLTNVINSNTATSILENDSYYAELTCPDGYEITSVQILMNNIDITSSVYTPKN